MHSRFVLIMKPLYFFPIIITCLCCTPPSEDCFITFHNESDKTICIDFDWRYPEDSTHVISWLIRSAEDIINPHSTERICRGTEKLDSWYYWFYEAQEYNGFVSFTIMDYDVIKEYKEKLDILRNQELYDKYDEEMEKYRKGYNVLARYDLLKEDLETLGLTLTYPPTQEMSFVHMFPEYKHD